MDSILDKILTHKHAEEIRGFEPVAMVQGLLTELNPREREVIIRRFGIPDGNNIETLEEIGDKLGVTRERIRQITKIALTRLLTIGARHDEVQRFSRVAEHLLRSYGDALEERYFVDQLLDFAHITKDNPAWPQAAACLSFLLDHIIANSIEHRPANDRLKGLYALHGTDARLLVSVAAALVSIIEAAKQPLTGDELVQQFRMSDVWRSNYEELIEKPVRIARDFYGSGLPLSAPCEPNEEARVVLAHAAAAAELDVNIYHEWGRRHWATIHPRRMNDKIYLILRHEKKPLHFVDISNRVNEVIFDTKVARSPSVHNELILDKRFVLVGRGLYALREWGYEPGTVADVIADLLRESDGLTREQIVKRVLERRLVKQQTIYLALMNKNKFHKTVDGHYSLVTNLP